MNIFTSIKQKLLLYVTVFIAFAVCTATVPALYYLSTNMDSQASKQVMQGLDGLNTVLDTYKNDAAIYAKQFARHPLVEKAVEEKDAETLVAVLGALAADAKLDSITVSDANGIVIARTHDAKKGDKVGNQVNVQKALNGSVSAAIESGTVVKLSARAGAPVRNAEGRIIGVITPGYNASNEEIVDRAKRMLGVEAELYLGDERVATTFEQDGKRIIGTKMDQKVADIVLARGQQFIGRVNILGQEHIVAYLPLKGPDDKTLGAVSTSLGTAALKAERNKMVLAICLAAACALGVAIFFTFLLAGGLAGPIGRLAEGVSKVAEGNLNQRVKVDSRDEIASLADSFNMMVDKLKVLVSRVSGLADALVSSSEELHDNAGQIANAAQQVAGSISEVAGGSQRQLNIVHETAEAVNQMSDGILQIASNADMASGMAAEAVNAADEGGRAMKDAVDQMARIETSVTGSAGVVAKLGEQSRQIGQISDTIAGIAGQTDLLALNAAVEAARAGEQGRGFAVVAEEVRKLAEQSQEAAQQISGLINEIQQDTCQAVEAMEQGTQEVAAGMQIIGNAGQNFNNIADIIQQVSGKVAEISQAIGQLANGSGSIVTAIQQIENVSKDAMGQTQTVSAAIEAQSAAMEQIAAASRSLADFAGELQKAASELNK